MKEMVNILLWGFLAALSVQTVSGNFYIGNRRFTIANFGRNWGDARRECQKQGLDLYVPKDLNELNQIIRLIRYTEWYVGGFVNDCNGLQRGSCSTVRFGRLTRTPCHVPLTFVCGPKCYQTPTAAPKTPKPTPKTTTTPKPTTKPPTPPPLTTTTFLMPPTLTPSRAPPTTTTTLVPPTVTPPTVKPTTPAPPTTTKILVPPTVTPPTMKPTTSAPPTTTKILVPPTVTTTTVKPTTSAPPTTTTTPPLTTPGCGDTFPDCAGLGERVCTGLKSWAKDHCAQFCGFCKRNDKKCEDFLNCPKYGDTVCSSAHLSVWVDKNCKKFCNRC